MLWLRTQVRYQTLYPSTTTKTTTASTAPTLSRFPAHAHHRRGLPQLLPHWRRRAALCCVTRRAPRSQKRTRTTAVLSTTIRMRSSTNLTNAELKKNLSALPSLMENGCSPSMITPTLAAVRRQEHRLSAAAIQLVFSISCCRSPIACSCIFGMRNSVYQLSLLGSFATLGNLVAFFAKSDFRIVFQHFFKPLSTFASLFHSSIVLTSSRTNEYSNCSH